MKYNQKTQINAVTKSDSSLATLTAALKECKCNGETKESAKIIERLAKTK